MKDNLYEVFTQRVVNELRTTIATYIYSSADAKSVIYTGTSTERSL